MTIQCVTIATNDHFQGNLIAQQHKLRHRSIIKRQNWEVPEIHGMEYDQYDNPATTYCVWSDEDGIARGVARLYPTDRPFMLQEHFGYMVEGELPRGSRILEGSRFCIDKNLPKEQRDRVAKELVLSYLEYAIDMNVESIIGIMYPIYWRNLFLKNDWEAKWLGEVKRTPEGMRSRAGAVFVSTEILQKVRKKMGIHDRVIDYGEEFSVGHKKAA